MEKINYHSIYIEAPTDAIGREIILWGEASWWPRRSHMRFERLTAGEIQVGTQYEQRVKLPMGPRWTVAVTALKPNQEIERTFLNGIFKGKETVRVESHINGGIVHYRMQFEMNGWVNAILWKLIFGRLHDFNIEMILKALKTYMEKG